MNMIPVESSNVKAVGHDPDTNTMHVQFHSGETYAVDGVDSEKHAAFMGAESKGRHFHRAFRKHHTVTKLT